MIEYRPISVNRLAVYLDGRKVGEIWSAKDGWYYRPTGAMAGETYPTLAEVKRSLESD